MSNNDENARPAILRGLARWAADARLETLPGPVKQVAIRCLIDTIAVIYAGSGEPMVARIRDDAGLDDSSRLMSTCIGTDRRAGAAHAALVNAAAGHVLDFDDACYAGIVHGSVVFLPAILAVAQDNGNSGKEVLEAFVVASEVAYALGDCVGDRLFMAGRFATGTFGQIGAAAGVAKLLGDDENQIARTIAIAASQPVGLRVNNGTDLKPLMVGRAAKLAVESGWLGQAGHTYPETFFEDETGFFHQFANVNPDLSQALTIGQRYRLLDPGIGVKRFPACTAIHPAVEALEGILEHETIAIDEIAAIDLEVAELVTASLPYDAPEIVTQARFSLPFAIACRLIMGGIRPEHLSREALHDPAVRALMKKVSHRTGDIADKNNLETVESARLRVTMSDGRVLKGRCDVPKGAPGRPLSDDELRQKFRDCVAPKVGDRNADVLLARIHSIEGLDDVSGLFVFDEMKSSLPG